MRGCLRRDCGKLLAAGKIPRRQPGERSEEALPFVEPGGSPFGGNPA
jgi:hypothetical protein